MGRRYAIDTLNGWEEKNPHIVRHVVAYLAAFGMKHVPDDATRGEENGLSESEIATALQSFLNSDGIQPKKFHDKISKVVRNALQRAKLNELTERTIREVQFSSREEHVEIMQQIKKRLNLLPPTNKLQAKVQAFVETGRQGAQSHKRRVEVEVVPIGSAHKSEPGMASLSYEERLKVFGRTAGGLLGRHIAQLPDGSSIGVGCGSSLYHSVMAMDVSPVKKNVNFFPFWGFGNAYPGDPLPLESGTGGFQVSATSLASELNYRFSNATAKNHMMEMFPGLLPLDSEDSEMEKWLKWASRINQSYVDIYGPVENLTKRLTGKMGPNNAGQHVPLVHRMALAIVTFGTPETPHFFFPEAIRSLAADSLPTERQMLDDALDNGLVGSIAGILLRKSDSFKESNLIEIRKMRADSDSKTKLNIREQILDTWTRHWIGVNEEELRAVVNAARPGVLGIACGAERGKVVCEALHRNLVNHLILDDQCANQVEHEIDHWNIDCAAK